MSTIRSQVAEEVRALCARRDMKQKDLAVVLGYSQPSVSDRYHGKTAYTLDDLERIAAHFDVNITDLFGTVDLRKDGTRWLGLSPSEQAQVEALAS
jgi:transcriptional regulator with XRE-family HTH domain